MSLTGVQRRLPPTKPARPLPCDCTARCGDDPWLKDGRATPCHWRAEYQALLAVRCAHCGALHEHANQEALK